jgi:uncharacterized protein (DUF2147 family)
MLKRADTNSGSVMRRLLTTALAGAAILGAVLPTLAAAAALPVTAVGVWRNPKNSVHIALRPCGPEICGYVVWASPKAEAAARKGGTEKLVGQQLMRGFKVDSSGVGRGRVFVPDLNKVFAGSAELVDARTMRAKGCLFAGVLCKTQLWVRIDNAPA